MRGRADQRQHACSGGDLRRATRRPCRRSPDADRERVRGRRVRSVCGHGQAGAAGDRAVELGRRPIRDPGGRDRHADREARDADSASELAVAVFVPVANTEVPNDPLIDAAEPTLAVVTRRRGSRRGMQRAHRSPGRSAPR